MTLKLRGYPITKSSNRTVVIGHPCDRTPITWQISAQRTIKDVVIDMIIRESIFSKGTEEPWEGAIECIQRDQVIYSYQEHVLTLTHTATLFALHYKLQVSVAGHPK